MSITVYNLYITTQLIIYGHPPNILNNNTEVTGQLEVETVTNIYIETNPVNIPWNTDRCSTGCTHYETNKKKETCYYI